MNNQSVTKQTGPVPAGHVVIYGQLGHSPGRNPNPSISYQLTTPNLTTGVLVELLTCLDQLGFRDEESDRPSSEAATGSLQQLFP